MKSGKLFASLTALCILMSPVQLNAQIDEVEFLKGGIDDANILFEEYVTPLANVWGADLNGGWYNTAKPHKLGGFDITFTFSTAWAPKNAREYDLSNTDLDPGIYNHNTSTTAPTIMGDQVDEVERPTIRYYGTFENPVSGMDTSILLTQYVAPNGTGIHFFPLPMAQLGIGLFKETDVTIRYLPNLNIRDFGKIGLWGVGLKHSVSQHIPFLKLIPVLDISVQGGYTKVNSSVNIDFPVDETYAVDATTPGSFEDQRIDMSVEGYTVNLIASQTLPVITFYQGVGYSNTRTLFTTVGKYPFFDASDIDTNPASPSFGKPVVGDEDVLVDPINLDIKNFSDVRLNAGFRLKFAVLTIHFDYTYANYSVFTTGLGVSFR